MNVNITISLGDVPLVAEALRREISRCKQIARRERRGAQLRRNPGATGPDINKAADADRRALGFEARAERCEELLKVLP